MEPEQPDRARRSLHRMAPSWKRADAMGMSVRVRPTVSLSTDSHHASRQKQYILDSAYGSVASAERTNAGDAADRGSDVRPRATRSGRPMLRKSRSVVTDAPLANSTRMRLPPPPPTRVMRSALWPL